MTFASVIAMMPNSTTPVTRPAIALDLRTRDVDSFELLLLFAADHHGEDEQNDEPFADLSDALNVLRTDAGDHLGRGLDAFERNVDDFRDAVNDDADALAADFGDDDTRAFRVLSALHRKARAQVDDRNQLTA